MLVENLLLMLFVIERLSCGTVSSLSIKGMNKYEISPSPGAEPIVFNHALVTTLFMFVGESLCFFLYAIHICREKRRSSSVQVISPSQEMAQKAMFKPVDIFKFAIPTMCDLISATIYNIALYYCDASTYEMLRNLTVVWVAIISLIVFKDFRRKFDFPEFIGLMVLIIGAILVSFAATYFAGQSTAINPALGVFLVIIGTFVSAIFYFSEEFFLRKIYIHPLKAVGVEGCWGLFFNSILMPIYNFCESPWSKDHGKFEDLTVWAYEMSECWQEIVILMAYTLLTTFFNQAGMELTSRASASFRTTFDCCRPIFVYLCCLMLKWETWDNVSSSIELVGFVLITLGVLWYNNVWILLPYCKIENAKTHHGKMVRRRSQEDAEGLIKAEEIVINQNIEE